MIWRVIRNHKIKLHFMPSLAPLIKGYFLKQPITPPTIQPMKRLIKRPIQKVGASIMILISPFNINIVQYGKQNFYLNRESKFYLRSTYAFADLSISIVSTVELSIGVNSFSLFKLNF